MDDLAKAEMLKNIALYGVASEEHKKVNHLVLGSQNNLNHIAGKSSGMLKIYPTISKRFQLILQTPEILKPLHPFEIRCVLCKSVIRYPAWYYSIRYAVNHFHYFVCFDSASPLVVNTKCYRRS